MPSIPARYGTSADSTHIIAIHISSFYILIIFCFGFNISFSLTSTSSHSLHSKIFYIDVPLPLLFPIELLPLKILLLMKVHHHQCVCVYGWLLKLRCQLNSRSGLRWKFMYWIYNFAKVVISDVINPDKTLWMIFSAKIKVEGFAKGGDPLKYKVLPLI